MKLLIEGFVRDAVRRGGQKRANLGNGLNVLSLGFAQDGREIFKALRKLFEAPACSLLLLFKMAADVGEPFLDAMEGLFAGGVDHRGDTLLGDTGSWRRVQDGADFGGAFIELRTGIARGRQSGLRERGQMTLRDLRGGCVKVGVGLREG